MSRHWENGTRDTESQTKSLSVQELSRQATIVREKKKQLESLEVQERALTTRVIERRKQLRNLEERYSKSQQRRMELVRQIDETPLEEARLHEDEQKFYHDRMKRERLRLLKGIRAKQGEVGEVCLLTKDEETKIGLLTKEQ